MAFLITAMCRNGAALRFDVLRNSYNACDAAAMDKSCAHEAQRILKAVESNLSTRIAVNEALQIPVKPCIGLV